MQRWRAAVTPRRYACNARDVNIQTVQITRSATVNSMMMRRTRQCDMCDATVGDDQMMSRDDTRQMMMKRMKKWAGGSDGGS